MKRFPALAALIALVLLSSACLEIQANPTETLPTAPAAAAVTTRTPTQTGTIRWFPATRTPTPFPTVEMQPTADQRPGLGEVILSDDMSGSTLWSTGESAAGKVSMGDQAVTLANPGQQGMLLSLRSNTNLANFYLEMTSNLSLCRGTDNYGVLVRSASAQDYYRFLISCNGQTRLERVSNGRATFLQDWTYSGQVPPGSPLVLKLGVWALGGDLRFFINDVYQFSAKDAGLTNGGVGVFSRGSGQNPLTVSFSDLKVYAINPGKVPTPAPTLTITPTITRTLPGPTRTATPVFMRTPTPKK